MRTTFALATLVASAAAQTNFCPEASRFGFTTATPTKLSVGQTFTITSNFTCSYNQYGIRPASVDYIIHNGLNNNGYEPAILVTRRSNNNVVDTFQATLPSYGWFPNASYTLETSFNYPKSYDGGPPVSLIAGPPDVFLTITPNVNV